MGGFLCARQLAPATRRSIISEEFPDKMRHVRKSVAVGSADDVQSALARAGAADAGGSGATPESRYDSLIAESRALVGHGGVEGTFPEEWDAQLLVDCGRSAEGDRVVIFCPYFLKSFLHDQDDLDRAFQFIFLSLDKIAMHEKYVFIYCFLGVDWSNPELASRLRLAYDILPRKYAKNLRRIYVLHATQGLKVTMWTFWAWLTQRTWDKIEYVGSLASLCELLQPGDAAAQGELRRHFPQAVQRNDAAFCGDTPPVAFGVPLRQLCTAFGVDFTDKTTGRWYPRLPPALVFLCETMEREAAEEHFGDMFSADAAVVYDMVEKVDFGEPLPPDTPMAAVWCVLKLYLDCLPSPLLSFSALDELRQRGVRKDDAEGKRSFLVWLFQNKLDDEAAYVALYTASFLRLMCQNAQDRLAASGDRDDRGRSSSAPAPEDADGVAITPALAATAFASSFFRPRALSEENRGLMGVAAAVLETLIERAQEPDLWVGRDSAAPRWDKAKAGGETDSSSDHTDQADEA